MPPHSNASSMNGPSAATASPTNRTPQQSAGSGGVMDPETLFENRTIDEIVSFSRSLSQDIDRKREELRTMVGERYRDLMEAAETITHMRESADMLINTVESVIAKGSEVHSKSLVGFHSNSSNSRGVVLSEDANEEYLSVAASIKLLMMAPEKIWSAVDGEQFLLAVQIYLFARHVHTNLTIVLDSTPASLMTTSVTSSSLSAASKGGVVGGKMSTAKIVSTYFPVVSRQWASIAHFYEAILEGCRKTLREARESEVGKAVRAMAAMALLKGVTAEELLTEFLSLRRSSLETQLQRDCQKDTAKVLMENSLVLIRTTVDIVHSAFASKEEEEGAEQHHSLSSVLAEAMLLPTLLLFETRQSPVFKHLPTIIGDFRPSLVHPTDLLEAKFLKDCLLAWLDGVHGMVSQETTSVLSHVSSIPALSTVRRHCYELLFDPKGCPLTMERWVEICRSVIGKEIDLWSEFYRGIFRDRAEALIGSQIAGSIYYVQSSLSLREQQQLQSDFLDCEQDLSRFLWSESNLNEVTSLPKFGDLGGSGSYGGGGARPTRPSMLELKAQGYSPRVQELCSQFDGMLEKLWQDLSQFLREKELAQERSSVIDSFSFLAEPLQAKKLEPFDLSADDEAILQFVQDSMTSHVDSLVSHVAGKYIDATSDRGLMLLLGRFYQAVPELCGSLEKCVTAPTSLAKRTTDLTSLAAMQQRRAISSKPDPQWATIRNKLDQECSRVLNKWVTSLTGDLREHLVRSLLDEPITLLQILPARDLIEISEEAEDGTSVKSKIRVPLHTSVALATGLAQFCHSVYSVAPYSLPTSIQLAASQQPAKVVCEVYREVSSRASINQTVALQLHFDVQFVSQCMVTRDNRELASACQEVLGGLESHIDPFDLSVFAPYMSTNVKKSILREHGLFSILIPADRYSLLASMKSSLPTGQSGQQQEQHNVMLAYSHRPDKIPLIPIPKMRRDFKKSAASGSANVLSVASALSSVSPVMGRRKRDKSPVAKAGGSFFEAMSTSWFGGK